MIPGYPELQSQSLGLFWEHCWETTETQKTECLQLPRAHKDMTTRSAELNWGTREPGNRLCTVWVQETIFLEIVKATVPIFNFKKKIKNHFAFREIFWSTKITYPRGTYWDRRELRVLYINNRTAQHLCDVAQLTKAAWFWIRWSVARSATEDTSTAYKLTGLHSQRVYKTLVQCGVTCEHLTHTAHTCTTSRSEDEVV